MSNVEIHTSKLTVTLGANSRRKDVIFIRIRTKSSLSYNKVASHCNSQILPPLIKIHQINYIFESQYLQIFLKDYVGLNMIVHFFPKYKEVEVLINLRRPFQNLHFHYHLHQLIIQLSFNLNILF